MDNVARFVVTKDYKVLWSKSGQFHDNIIQDHDLQGEKDDLAMVVMSPPFGSFLSPIDTWGFEDSVGIRPEWWNRERGEKAVRNELPRWLASNVVMPSQSVDFVDHYVHAVYGNITTLGENGYIRIVYDGGKIDSVFGEITFVYGSVGRMKAGSVIHHLRGSVSVVEYGASIPFMYGCKVGTLGGEINEATGGSRIDIVLRFGSIHRLSGRSIVRQLAGTITHVTNSVVSMVSQSGKIGAVTDNSLIGTINGGSVGTVFNSTVGNVTHGGVVGTADNGAVIRCAGGGVVDKLMGNSIVNLYNGGLVRYANNGVVISYQTSMQQEIPGAVFIKCRPNGEIEGAYFLGADQT